MVFDPASPSFVADPYPAYEHLRKRDPVHRSPAGAWILTRHADVSAALSDDRLGNAPARYAVVAPRNRERYVCANVASNILPFLDPPAHTEPRRLIGRAFTARLRSTPPDLGALAHALIDRWSSRRVDIVGDFASPLSVHVIASLIGIPEADRPRLERWSETFFYLFASIPSREIRNRLDQDLADFRAYLNALVDARRSEPRDDLISDLVVLFDRETQPASSLVDNVMLLFADGVENVDRAIGNAVWSLLHEGDDWARLVDDRGGLRRAVDECLRFESPGQYIARVTREPVRIHDTSIPEGAHVLLVLGAANRDADVFSHADRFDISRDPNPHLAFGRGRHSCIGGPLVEQQMCAALDVLLQRAPELRLAQTEPRWIPRAAHRWIERVLVDVGVGA